MDNISKFYLDSLYIKEKIGFTYTDVSRFSLEELEKCHDYIQWAFPTEEASAFNPNAPFPGEETLRNFADISVLSQRMSLLTHRMIRFYFHDPDFDWVTPRNHNFLRITRILKCLKLFKIKEEHELLKQYIEGDLLSDAARVNIIGPVTLKFWTEAMDYEKSTD